MYLEKDFVLYLLITKYQQAQLKNYKLSLAPIEAVHRVARKAGMGAQLETIVDAPECFYRPT